MNSDNADYGARVSLSLYRNPPPALEYIEVMKGYLKGHRQIHLELIDHLDKRNGFIPALEPIDLGVELLNGQIKRESLRLSRQADLTRAVDIISLYKDDCQHSLDTLPLLMQQGTHNILSKSLTRWMNYKGGATK